MRMPSQRSKSTKTMLRLKEESTRSRSFTQGSMKPLQELHSYKESIMYELRQ